MPSVVLRNTSLSFILASGFAWSAAPAPARADLKIVTEVTVTRSPPDSSAESKPGASAPASSTDKASPLIPPRPESPAAPAKLVTTYYQGQSARVEAADGSVTIYDRAKENVYTLHPADKTYSLIALKKMLEQEPSLISRQASNGRMKLETKVDLTADKEASKKTFAGREAIRYTLTGSASVKRETRSGFGRGGFPGGGRFPGRGRFPGGGFPGGYFQGGYSEDGDSGGYGRRGRRSGSMGQGMPSMQIEGEYWIADAPSLGTKMKDALLPSFIETVPAGPFVSPLKDKLAKIKGFPVSSRVSVTSTNRRSDTTTSITTTTEVKSITDGPLDAVLFQVPNDYKKVDVPPVSVARNQADARR
jgi:hypothetical protein